MTTVTAGVVSVSAGVESVEPGTRGVLWETAGAVVEPVHLVQITDVEVKVTVETVVPVVTTEEPPVVTVLVTGQVVTVVYVTTVVVESSGAPGVEPASTLDGPGDADVIDVTAGGVSVTTGVESGTAGVL